MIDLKDYSNVLIVGAGKVGSSIGSLIEKTGQFNVVYEDPFKGKFAPDDFVPHIIHICIPLYDRESFTSDIQRIIERFVKRFEKSEVDFYDIKRIIIVDSTIVLGILPALQRHFGNYCGFVYSPIRATDAIMEEELLQYERYYAPVSEDDMESENICDLIEEYYSEIGFTYRYFENSEALVLGKLSSVCWYTMNIAFAQQLDQICRQHGIDFDEAYTQFNIDEKIGHKYDPETKSADYMMERPTFFPGIIGGNCCIPDAILMLREQYGDPSLWRWILQTNEKQKMALQNGIQVIHNNPSTEPGTNILQNK